MCYQLPHLDGIYAPKNLPFLGRWEGQPFCPDLRRQRAEIPQDAGKMRQIGPPLLQEGGHDLDKDRLGQRTQHGPWHGPWTGATAFEREKLVPSAEHLQPIKEKHRFPSASQSDIFTLLKSDPNKAPELRELLGKPYTEEQIKKKKESEIKIKGFRWSRFKNKRVSS